MPRKATVTTMARPTKCRRICHLPDTLSFTPTGNDQAADRAPILLTLDEFETVRLIDHEQHSQEECSTQMGISRTTVQKIYETARQKLAAVLVEGHPLRIEGGDYTVCDGASRHCHNHTCYKQEIRKQYTEEKGDTIMRIAVTYENGEIFGHFGHTEQFKIYDVEDGKITDSRIVDTNGQGHGALAEVLRALHTDVLICGGIGGGAQMALASAGIRLYGGVAGNADAAVAALLADNLAYNPDVKCDHHDHAHGEGHTCGSHGCGKGSCGKH